jgi:hypothetical protein
VNFSSKQQYFPKEKIKSQQGGTMLLKSMTLRLILSTIILIMVGCDKATDPPQGTDPPQISIAVLTTTTVTGITSTSATGGGNITSDGGAAVTARGVCWSKNSNPSITDSKTNDGISTGSFTSTITGLDSNTTYNVRAYATNSAGTGYGSPLTFFTSSTNNQLKYLGQTPPGNTPVLLVPQDFQSNNTWFWHGRVDFLNDGTEMFMDVYNQSEGGIRIYYSKLLNGSWTTPSRPQFGSQYVEGSPTFSNTGNRVYFISDRPNGRLYAIWYSDRNGNNWSAPTPVVVAEDQTVGMGWEISVTENETIFGRMVKINDTSNDDIYVIKKINGQYSTPEKLGTNINTSYHEWCVFVDPAEDYMIFCSDRPGGFGGFDLYISFKDSNGDWEAAKNMGASINTQYEESSPSVSPDKKYLFFKSDRLGDRNPFWVTSSIIANLK